MMVTEGLRVIKADIACISAARDALQVKSDEARKKHVRFLLGSATRHAPLLEKVNGMADPVATSDFYLRLVTIDIRGLFDEEDEEDIDPTDGYSQIIATRRANLPLAQLALESLASEEG